MRSPKSSTRQVFSRENFHDSYTDYDVDKDGDDDDGLFEQVFAPVVENGVTVMKVRFQKRDGNHNQRPPRSPRTMFPRTKFPNEDLQHAWMRTSNAE